MPRPALAALERQAATLPAMIAVIRHRNVRDPIERLASIYHKDWRTKVATVTQAECKSLAQPDETRSFPKGRLDIVSVGGTTIGRATFEPGWKWSESIKPIVKTESCQAPHLGYVISGRMKVVMDDGSEIEFGPGDAMSLPPGHDAWIVGPENCVVVDFVGFGDYAKSG
jgi:hypothetical protein